MQVPRHRAWEGFVACVHNARDLLDAAAVLSREEFDGASVALTVLSVEESAKALALLSRALESADSHTDPRAYFSQHRVKHSSAALFLLVTAMFEEMADQVDAIENDPDVPEHEYGSELVRRCSERFRHYMDTDVEPVVGLCRLLEAADETKQKGLYVDFASGQWTTPRDLSTREYEDMFGIARQMVQLLEGVAERSDLDEIRRFVEESISAWTFREGHRAT